MRNKVVGDSFLAIRSFISDEGQTVTQGDAYLRIVDGAGSTVFNGTIADATGGTWKQLLSSAGYNLGPLTEYWTLKGSQGTYSYIDRNEHRIVGTEGVSPYVQTAELKNYYQDIEDYFDDEVEASVVSACRDINSRLMALGIKLPVKTVDGYEEQTLKDLNAYEALWRIAGRRASNFVRNGDDKPWYTQFQDEADRIWKRIQKKEVVFARDVNPSSAGISQATRVVGSSKGTMDTNWQGFGKGFTGADFPRTWRVEIIGTGVAGELNEGTFRYSKDNGLSWDGTLVGSTAFVHIDQQVYVRFHRGTWTGTTNLLAIGDTWTFDTTPMAHSVGGKYRVKAV